MKKNTVRALALGLAILIALTLLAPILAQGATNEEILGNLKDQIAQQQEILSGIKTDKEKAQAEANNRQAQVNNTQAQIRTMAAAIAAKETEVAQKQDELDAKKQEYQATNDLFKQRLRAMYIMQNGSALSTVLNVNSFSEFLTASETLKRISTADTDLLTKLETEQKEIEEEQTALDQELSQLETQKSELEAKKQQYYQQLTEAKGAVAAKEAEQKLSESKIQELLAAKAQVESEFTGSTGDFVGGDWIWPVPGYSNISSPFGYRTWSDGTVEFHNGIDINKGSASTIMGAPIVASNSGRVIRAKYNAGGYGYYVMIDHGGNNYTLYGHCSSLAVTTGQWVTQGQVIAYVGSTGNSTGPHLHFEIRINGVAQNPLNYLSSRG